LRRAADFQIIQLPQAKRTTVLTITVQDAWQEDGSGGTGIGKVRVFAQPNTASFTMRSMENYNAMGGNPVKRAMLSVVNPGAPLTDARLRISRNGTMLDDITLGTIDAHAVTVKEIWTLIPSVSGEYDVALSSGGRTVATQPKVPMTAFRKSYFDGGKVLVNSTNHNDLGWLGTQFETADYRSKAIILPALSIMEANPEFTYTMEAVAYLREFIQRHPEKKDEIFKRTAERRFSWGAQYTLSLQGQVGGEKLVRQFYFGRRWLKENVPGADTRIYINADVPMVTWQLPQILKSAGVEFLVQARIPLGFYYWEGLDGTTVPVYGLRYGNSPRISPKANEEWLNLVYGREDFARKSGLPRTMIYDYNEDYLPPNGEFVPFVKEQNAMMSAFATAWNRQHAGDADAQVRPPVLEFTSPEDMLRGVFATTGMHLRTMRGEWPNAWAYYDEPGNREALLQGRKAHNLLLSAEKLLSLLRIADPAVHYPKQSFDAAWQANLWPDHGWGGGKGLTTDSIYHASYRISYEGGRELMDRAMQSLADRVARSGGNAPQIVVYNPLNWDRREPVRSTFTLPKDWPGFAVKDARGTAVPFEILGQTPAATTVMILTEVPALGYATYRIERAVKTEAPVRAMIGDSIETSEFKVVFGNAGITEYRDKIARRSYFRTDKFQAGEILQFAAPGNAWEDEALLKGIPLDLERSSTHASKTVRFVETPLRWIRETETPLGNCVARHRYSVSKQTHDVELELELADWNGTKAKEVRIAFPMNIERKITTGLTTVPASCVTTPDGKSRGLLGEYFRNPNVDGEPVFTRVDTIMAPYWDKASPGEGVPKDFFSVRWTGTLHVPETGNYTLGIITDDKGRLYFEGACVVDNWNPYELNTMKTFSTHLEKGKEYAIRIDFADIVEYAGLRFQWRKEEEASDAKATAAISYEIPFGAVEFNKDEADFSLLPDNKESQYYPNLYGGYEQIAFREALNWVNVSTGSYKGYGCLFASDVTVHMFEDQTMQPVQYPVVQHVLLSTRKSLAWDPEYWFDQKGDHTYRMAMMFHDGNWRQRYRDAIAFNNPLMSVMSTGTGSGDRRSLPQAGTSFLRTEPSNIVITSVKQSEDGTGTVVRFYEAEGDQCAARLTMSTPIREAIRTDLLEYPSSPLPVAPDGSLILQVKPWEIVTLLIKK
jgi:alpha-mannosidase